MAGDVETGKVILRDDINATGGFEKLGAAAKMPLKSLMRISGSRRKSDRHQSFQRPRILKGVHRRSAGRRQRFCLEGKAAFQDPKASKDEDCCICYY